MLFNAASALFGGICLLAEPDGGILKMPLTWLENSPFPDYLIPGLILFICLGVSSLITVLYVIRNKSCAGYLIILQGVMNLAWIVTQIIVIRILFWLQFVYGGIGLVFLIAGIYLLVRKKTA